MTTTLTKTETAEFLNEIETTYEQPVIYQLRASSKWVTKSYKERSLLERLAKLDLANKKKITRFNLKIPIHHQYIIFGLNKFGYFIEYRRHFSFKLFGIILYLKIIIFIHGILFLHSFCETRTVRSVEVYRVKIWGSMTFAVVTFAVDFRQLPKVYYESHATIKWVKSKVRNSKKLRTIPENSLEFYRIVQKLLPSNISHSALFI
jgi:hypothetical protein